MKKLAAIAVAMTGVVAFSVAVASANDEGAGSASKAASNGRIVFQAGVGSKAPQLFTILPDGTDMNRVTDIPTGDPRKDPGAENPVWSPDGSTIMFDALTHGTPPGTKVNLFTVSPSGTGLAQLPLLAGKFSGDPAYSPDGKQISFDEDNSVADPRSHGIFIANADGSNPHQLTLASRSPTGAFDTESQWSPDGQTIAFTRVKSETKAAIFTIGVDGNGLTQLTPYKLDAASPDWSPNGKAIAFNSYWDSPHGNVAQVMTMRPDGSHQKAITKDHFGRKGQIYCFRPSWAPDGTRIVFVRFKVKGESGVVALYTMDPDGGNLDRVTTAKHVFPLNPDWGTAP
jgi:Tol biopolymer transport system component